MPRTSSDGPRKMTGIKFAPDVQRRIDRVFTELKAKVPGIELPTSSVISQLVKRGLDSYERELGIKTKAT